MTQDVKFVVLEMFFSKDSLLLGHKKCGEWPYLFATIVASTKILLDIATLEQPGFLMLRFFNIICNKYLREEVIL